MTRLCPPPSLPDLFPSGVAFAIAPLGDAGDDLHPEERSAVADAIESRRREFAAGRALARRQLARLGVDPGPIPARADRTPIWPEGVVGSISHCADLCAVVVARADAFRSLGLDVWRSARASSSGCGRRRSRSRRNCSVPGTASSSG